VPATTLVISPCGIEGNGCKSPAPSIYSPAPPVKARSIEPLVVIGDPLITKELAAVVISIEVTVPVLELVPAPIKDLTSAADIPLFKLGVVPLDRIAGVPVSDTFPLLVIMFDACVVDIVVVSPALAVVLVVPIVRLEVPAPIKDLTSAALIPVFRDGVVPLDNIAGTPCNEAAVI
jgi:hypothetical protein|tara:strand:+ start:136 stop:663 length:528 start_codon:yes stop_codon:yes gene_type:complete